MKTKIYTDAEIDAALATKWAADGGGPEDGYKVEKVRELFDKVYSAIEQLDAVMFSPNRLDVVRLKKAIEKLEGRHDSKHPGFCWPDIVDACWEIVEAVEKPKRLPKKKKRKS